MAKRGIPADLLKAKQPVMVKLSKSLAISRWHAYGLVDPDNYPDAIPADLFDVRSDLAERVAAFIDMPVTELRDFYAKRKAA